MDPSRRAALRVDLGEQLPLAVGERPGRRARRRAELPEIGRERRLRSGPLREARGRQSGDPRVEGRQRAPLPAPGDPGHARTQRRQTGIGVIEGGAQVEPAVDLGGEPVHLVLGAQRGEQVGGERPLGARAAFDLGDRRLEMVRARAPSRVVGEEEPEIDGRRLLAGQRPGEQRAERDGGSRRAPEPDHSFGLPPRSRAAARRRANSASRSAIRGSNPAAPGS